MCDGQPKIHEANHPGVRLQRSSHLPVETEHYFRAELPQSFRIGIGQSNPGLPKEFNRKFQLRLWTWRRLRWCHFFDLFWFWAYWASTAKSSAKLQFLIQINPESLRKWSLLQNCCKHQSNPSWSCCLQKSSMVGYSGRQRQCMISFPCGSQFAFEIASIGLQRLFLPKPNVPRQEEEFNQVHGRNCPVFPRLSDSKPKQVQNLPH